MRKRYHAAVDAEAEIYAPAPETVDDANTRKTPAGSGPAETDPGNGIMRRVAKVRDGPFTDRPLSGASMGKQP